MKKNIFMVVSDLFRSIEKSVVTANELDKSYAESIGKLDEHAPINHSDTQKIAENLSSLYAADTAGNIIAKLRSRIPTITEDDYIAALKDILVDKLTPNEVFIVKNLANLAWRISQPFKDMDKAPLMIINRDVNIQFNLLSQNEQDKDLSQIKKGAEIILRECA